MADARSIILHEYPTSPFAEKVRLTLKLKNLAYSRVEIPVIMPRPDLMPLTGGYRRTPVMQIGADVYCDTAIILRELESRFATVSLRTPGHEGLGQMVAGWADSRWFQSSVAIIFGERADTVPEAFKKDREALSGRPFDTEGMKRVAPMMRDQWRARLMLIEERLQAGKGAGAGIYLIGAKPGFVDVHAYMNVWFMMTTVPDFANECLEKRASGLFTGRPGRCCARRLWSGLGGRRARACRCPAHHPAAHVTGSRDNPRPLPACGISGAPGLIVSS